MSLQIPSSTARRAKYGIAGVEPHRHGSGASLDQRTCSRRWRTRPTTIGLVPDECGEVVPRRPRPRGIRRFAESRSHRPRHNPADRCSSCHTEYTRTSILLHTKDAQTGVMVLVDSVLCLAWSRRVKCRRSKTRTSQLTHIASACLSATLSGKPSFLASPALAALAGTIAPTDGSITD